jgi:hypothetical protein
LKYSEREEYCKLAIEARLKEFDLQWSWIEMGMKKILPDWKICSLLSYKEVEVRICGSNVVSIADLKAIINFVRS